jgi:AcrR family transcriptional regulator
MQASLSNWRRDSEPESGLNPRAPATPQRVGRPRRFDDETERGMLMDAAMRVMAANGYAGMSVGDVLSEAGLSTRAFYRHFDGREALLAALIRRDSEAVGGSLERAVDNAAGPLAALDAWLESHLDVFYEPRRAARTALFSSPAVMAALPLASELEEMRQIFCQPLIEVLRAGHESGILRSPTPEADAYSLFTLVSAVANGGDRQFLSRSEAKAHVMRFSWPAFGLTLED